MRLAFAALFFALTLSFGCATLPPVTSPQAKVAFYGTQVIQDLDILRDTVIHASLSTPPIISVEAATRFVHYHRYAVTLVHDAPQGYQVVVKAGLDDYVKSLNANELAVVAPYAALITSVLQEVK